MRNVRRGNVRHRTIRHRSIRRGNLLRRSLLRSPALLLAVSLGSASAFAIAGPAAASTSTSTSGYGSQVSSATLLLRTPDAAATDRLAAARGLSHADRMSRLRATMAPATETAAVERAVAARGLTVDHVTPWTLVVHGPDAAAAAAGVPGVASVVAGGGPSVVHPLVERSLSGPDFRAAYSASSAAPPAGASMPTIATLQFSGWNAADLTNYIGANGLPPLGIGQYVGVPVDNANVGLDDGTGGSEEVALDEESIYATDPYANQRTYISNDSDPQHVVDAFQAVAADVAAGVDITALSTSWGGCEHDPDVTLNDYTAMHAAITAVVAAGVTVFAASGDDGALCADGQPGLSFPASDPLVVAVGGTTLDLAGPTETGWGVVDKTQPSGFSGSGGGQSVLFQRPAYQAAVAPTAAGREVPDIAADADPATGFVVVHDFGDGHGPVTDQLGGTSLAAPISAALLTAELGSRGVVDGGVGDIHNALYSAPATTFRDIVAGSNDGYSAGPGYDMVTGFGAVQWHLLVNQILGAPTVTVPVLTGSDTVPVTVTTPAGETATAWVTGSGTPPTSCGTSDGKPAAPPAVTLPGAGTYTIWALGYLTRGACIVGTATTTVVTTGPTVTLSAKASTAKGRPVTYGWTVVDTHAPVATVTERLLRNGKLIWSGSSTGTSQVTLKGTTGSSYELMVTAADAVGNATSATHVVGIAADDTAFTVSHGWSRVRSHSAFGGKILRSAVKGATARVKAYGSTFSLVTTTCSTCGVLGVYVGGKHVRNISLYSRAIRAQAVITLAAYKSVGVRQITLLVKGTKGPGSKGTWVNVDGLLAV